MQVEETLSEGLKREYKVVLPKGELDERISTRLASLKDRVNLPGFRPGKVPLPHLKRVYGKAVMSEVIEQAIADVNTKIVSDGGFRLAMEPKVTFASEQPAAINEVIEGKADLAYTVALEILPKIELVNFKTIKLEKPVAPVTDAEVDEAIGRIAEANRSFSAKEGKAAKGDRVVISFKGKIGGEPFEGGEGEDVPVVLGSGRLIPGFEDQLIGYTVGGSGTVKVKFPDDYVAERVAGRDAEFDVTVKSVEAPDALALDDTLAQALGAESLEKLKQQLRERISHEHFFASRQKVKRKLLDALDKLHRFEAPPSLVEQEFQGIWRSIEQDMEKRRVSFQDEGTTEDKARAEYKEIADRRVRLGLVLAEIGERNKIQVSNDEITRAIHDQARQFPGREQQILEYYKQNPMAVAEIRSPIFEDKVIDFLLELAEVSEKPVSREQLFAEEEEAEEKTSAKGKGGKAAKGAKKA
ncbi:MAG TPA: trigger factor [Xanthobacteraceae bacterium]|nr:trigger factor [Xanthobacteraceae bacterium]